MPCVVVNVVLFCTGCRALMYRSQGSFARNLELFVMKRQVRLPGCQRPSAQGPQVFCKEYMARRHGK